MSTAGSVGPGQRTKILHVAQCSQKKKRQRERERPPKQTGDPKHSNGIGLNCNACPVYKTDSCCHWDY